MTEASKKLKMKKLYQVLVVIDDFAHTPQLHKPHGALDTLFIRASLDFKAAHKQVQVRREEHGLLLFAFQNNSTTIESVFFGEDALHCRRTA